MPPPPGIKYGIDTNEFKIRARGGGGALSIIVCYVCAAVKTPVFSPKDPFQSIMISVETAIFTLFPFRRPQFLPRPVPVHREFGDPRPERFGGNRPFRRPQFLLRPVPVHREFGDPRPEIFGGKPPRGAPLISPPLQIHVMQRLSRARDITRPIMPCNARGWLIGRLCMLASSQGQRCRY